MQTNIQYSPPKRARKCCPEESVGWCINNDKPHQLTYRPRLTYCVYGQVTKHIVTSKMTRMIRSFHNNVIVMYFSTNI